MHQVISVASSYLHLHGPALIYLQFHGPLQEERTEERHGIAKRIVNTIFGRLLRKVGGLSASVDCSQHQAWCAFPAPNGLCPLPACSMATSQGSGQRSAVNLLPHKQQHLTRHLKTRPSPRHMMQALLVVLTILPDRQSTLRSRY